MNRILATLSGLLILYLSIGSRAENEPSGVKGLPQWKGTHGGPAQPTMLLARNREQWLQLQQVFNLRGPLPNVNFSTHMVLAIGLGTRPTGGHEVTILGAEERKGILYIRYRERRPSPGEFVTQALTSPYHIKVLPRSEVQKVFFENVQEPSR